MKSDTQFEKGELLIWNSGFGYEIVEYVGVGNMYNSYTAKCLSGRNMSGFMTDYREKFKKLTEEEYKSAVNEYGYHKNINSLLPFKRREKIMNILKN